jgi:predicted PurR-regulated permease PerM
VTWGIVAHPVDSGRLLYRRALVLAAGMYLIPPLAAQPVAFAESIPSYQEGVRHEAAGLVAEYERIVPATYRTQIEANLGALGSQLTTVVRSAARVTLGAVETVVGIFAGLALLPLWIFYVLKDERRNGLVLSSLAEGVA